MCRGCRILALQVREDSRRARPFDRGEAVSGQGIHSRVGALLACEPDEHRRKEPADDVLVGALQPVPLGRAVRHQSAELPQQQKGRGL